MVEQLTRNEQVAGSTPIFGLVCTSLIGGAFVFNGAILL